MTRFTKRDARKFLDAVGSDDGTPPIEQIVEKYEATEEEIEAIYEAAGFVTVSAPDDDLEDADGTRSLVPPKAMTQHILQDGDVPIVAPNRLDGDPLWYLSPETPDTVRDTLDRYGVLAPDARDYYDKEDFCFEIKYTRTDNVVETGWSEGGA